MKARVSSAVLKLSDKKSFRGAHFGMSIGDWKHVVAMEKAHGEVPDKIGCPSAGEIFLSISSTSTGTYKLSDILGALGVNVDPGVGDSSIFRDLTFSDLAAVLRGHKSDFGIVLSASAKYRDLDMSVVLAVSGLGIRSRPTAAIHLAVLNKDALNKILSYIGIPISSVLPEVQIGNIQVVGATREFQADQHCGLEDVLPFPAVVPAGLHFSLDIDWKTCTKFLCKGWAKIMPGQGGKPALSRLQGGATMKGFTFNLGEADSEGKVKPTFGWKYSISPRVASTESTFPRVPSAQIDSPNMDIAPKEFQALQGMDGPNAVARYLGAEPAEMHAEIKFQAEKAGQAASFMQWVASSGVNLGGDKGMYCKAFAVSGEPGIQVGPPLSIEALSIVMC